MLSLNRWTPFTDLAGLHRDLDTLFGRVFGETARPQPADAFTAFTPTAEVKRDGAKWLIALAIPGVSPEDVEIDVVGRTLRVRGERRAEDTAKAEPILSEVSYGRFEREFTLPDEIDGDGVQAAYRQGMLELMLPLKESAKPRRIAIKGTGPAKELQAA